MSHMGIIVTLLIIVAIWGIAYSTQTNLPQKDRDCGAFIGGICAFLAFMLTITLF